jgi:hypothetical protein
LLGSPAQEKNGQCFAKKRKALTTQEASTGLGVRHPLLHLPSYKSVENNVAGNCVDGLYLPPVTEDHKIQLRIRDRQFFIDTLDDWKWFGPEGKQPGWYTGKDWS